LLQAKRRSNTILVIAALLHDTIENAGVPKAERKRLQIVNAPKKSVRAQFIKLADKISNLSAILSSPPHEWSTQRKREYFEWAKRIVDGLAAPNEILKAESDRLYRMGESLGF
jgi:GTP diphosphokinase / guanosine-3',5'-bis(diphosphate) 3'-diphosphatase